MKKRKAGDITRAKKRIQKLLTELVRIRDNGCAFKNYPEAGKCGGYTAADHIRSRQFSETYAKSENVICLCTAHHIFWKKRHPMEWAKLVEDFLGKGWIEELRSKSIKSRTWTLDMWLKEEETLKEELLTIKNNKNML